MLLSVDGRFSNAVSVRGIRASGVKNLAAAGLQVTDLSDLRSLGEDLDTLDASLLLLLSHASQVELEMAKHSALCVVECLLDLILCQDSFAEEAFQAVLKLGETHSASLLEIVRLLSVQQVKSEPKDVHEMADGFWLLDAEVASHEDEVANDVVGDPLELVGLEARLILVPVGPVLACSLALVLDELEDEFACNCDWVLCVPQRLNHIRLQQVLVEESRILAIADSLGVGHHR